MPGKPGNNNVPKKRKPVTTDSKGKRQQYSVSFSPSYAKRVEAVAEALKLDGTSLLRMIIAEHFAEYEKRAEAVRKAETTSGE